MLKPLRVKRHVPAASPFSARARRALDIQSAADGVNSPVSQANPLLNLANATTSVPIRERLTEHGFSHGGFPQYHRAGGDGPQLACLTVGGVQEGHATYDRHREQFDILGSIAIASGLGSSIDVGLADLAPWCFHDLVQSSIRLHYSSPHVPVLFIFVTPMLD